MSNVKASKGLKALFAAMLACVLGLGAYAATGAWAADEDPSDAPQHTKTLSAQKEDGSYDLTLDVIGQNVASNEPVDIVLVMDTSGSMEGTRLTNSKNAAKQFVAKFLTDENAKLPADEQVQISLITFGTKVKQNNDFTADDSTINRQINNQNANGGTNWQDAFQAANNKNSNRTGAKKYIVFLSDGDPTFRNDAYGANRRDRDDGYSDYYGAWGNGSSDPHNRNYNAAKDAANARGDATLFVISTASGADTKMNNLAKDTGGAFYKGHDATSLNTALDEVAKFIKQDVGYQDVKITDKLSDYVDFTSLDTSKVTVTKTSADGTKVVMPSSQYDLSFNEADRTVTLDLSKTGKLESGATYSMTFNVKPNETAYQKAVDEGKTGSETLALDTNDNNGTTVKYKTVTTFGGETTVSDEKTAHYDVPTMPVPVKTITVNKVWANDTNPATGQAESHNAVKADIKQGDKIVKTVELNSGNDWSASAVVSANPDYKYSVDETNVPEGYEKSVSGEGANFTITNTHKTWSTTANIEGTKQLNGRDLAEGEFSFEISAAEGTPMPQSTTVKNAADGTFNFGDITYTEPGNYTYTVKEAKGELGGVDYDSTEYTVAVTVTEEKAEGTAHGKLVTKVAITGADAIKFTNTYNASGELSGEQAISGSKQLADESGAWTGGLAGFEFKVELVDEQGNTLDPSQYGVTLPVVNAFSDESGNFAFDTIKFSKPGNASYYFKVSEVTPATQAPGMTYSTQSYIVKVDVTDNGDGTLTAKQAGTTPEGGIVFTNTYTTTPSDAYAPVVIKGVAGKDATAGQFTFKIEAADETTKTAIDDGSIKIDGRQTPEYSQTKQNTTAIAKGKYESVSFEGMTFSKAGTYTFTVSEDTTGAPEGWTYDSTAYTIKVVVAADANAKLVATPTITKGDAAANGLNFSNTFGASTTYGAQGGLSVTKQLDGRALAADQFSFTITGNDDASIAKLKAAYNDTYPETFKNEAPGEDGLAHMAAMNAVAFDQDDIDKTFTYTVTENTTAMAGYTFDENATATVAITVKEEGGKLYTETVVTKGGQSTTYNSKSGAATALVPFVNKYSASTDVEGGTAASIDATKTLTGRDLAKDEFTFNVVNTADEQTVVATATNDADGKLNFTINYDTKTLAEMVTAGTAKETTVDGKRAWVLNYKASEITPAGGSGMTVEKGSFTFSVTVVDNGDGTLTATAALGDGQEATFKNAYGKGAKTDATFTATKTLTGRDQKASEFSFTVTPKGQESSVLTGSAAAAKNGEPSNVTFGDEGKISYTIDSLNKAVEDGYADQSTVDGKRTWTVHYTVSENTPFSDAKVSVADGAQTSYDVDVVVTDNGDGTITAAAPKTVAFNNVYTPENGVLSGETNLNVSKTLKGHDIQGSEEFTFKIAAVDPATAPLPETDTVTVMVNSDGTGSANFGDITYDQAGTYVYTITEVKAESSDTQYDAASYTVTVEVTYDSAEGKYNVSSSMKKGEESANVAAFTNYKPTKSVSGVTEGNVQVGDTVTYTVNYRNTNAEAANITITDVVPQGITVTQDGVKDGGVLADGTITWTLENVEAGAEGTVSFTGTVAESALSVDEINNTATVKVGEDGPAIDTNIVPVDKPEVGSLSIAKKVVVASGSPDDNEFTFTLAELKDKAGNDLTGSYTIKLADGSESAIAKDGTFTLKKDQSVTISGLPAGATYKVTEDKVDGYTADKEAVSGTVAKDGTSETFTNTYNTGSSVDVTAGVEVMKSLTGRDWKSTDAFAFTIKADSNTAGIEVSEMPLPAQTTATAATDGEHKAVFGTMTFTKEGTYTYKVTENQDALPGGVTAADPDQAATVTITVSDNKKGALTASVTVANGTFTNNYKPGSVTLKGETAIKGQKTLAGHSLTEAKEFGFTLAPTEDYGEKVVYGEGATAATASVQAKDETKGFTFGDITFNEVGEYSFNVTENGATETVAGWTLDTHTSTVTVSVTDPDKGGQLQASVKYGDGDLCKFTNTYTLNPVTVTGATDLAGTKSLTGRTLNAGEFTFTIAVGEGSAENTPLPSPTTATNDASGNFNFGDIIFTEPGTYYYSIAEVTDGLADKGITAKTGAKQVKIVVTDNNAGQLVAEVTQPEGGLAFENAYKPESVSTTVSVHKSIDAEKGLNKPELEGNDFDFTISAAEGTPLPTETTKSNDASGTVTFGDFTFTKEDLGGEMEKAFTYTVTESADKTKPGVTNDSTPKTFTITVKDNGDGTMTATNSTTDNPVNFVNTYTVTPVDYSVTTDVSVTKELTGRTLNEGEFEFQLVDASGNVVAEAKNAADGSVTFGTQNYTKPGVTTYTIVEKAGSLGGVTYDTSSYAVKVTVTDNGDGTLSAKAELQGAESATFKNTYKAAPTSVTLGAAKTLEGASLKDGQFSFELADSEGNVLQTVKNAADGSIAFDPIEFTEAGQFTYTLTEVNDGASNITYDATKYTVVVTVTDDGTGALKAAVSYNNGKSDDFVTDAPVFANTYTPDPAKPANPVDDNGTYGPKTGDGVLPFVAGIVAALAAAGAAVSYRFTRRTVKVGKHSR